MVQLYRLDISTAGPSLDLGSVDITEDASIRSPRTPIYQPKSSFSPSLSPFDPAKLFTNLSAPLILKAVELTTESLPPLPNDPLAWVWQCHLCRSRWPLGVTRRCLVDGHFYCSGETSQPSLRKKKKGKSCSSEFDYVGWKEWGAWKRNALKTISNSWIPKGCERCEFPSQCRYRAAEKELIDDQPGGSPMTDVEYSSTTAEDDVARYYANEQVRFESILAKAEAAGNSVQTKVPDFWQADKQLKRSKNVGGKLEDKIVREAAGRPYKESSLSPIEEEAFKSEIGTGL